jgi:hypothetical protein
MPRMSHSLQFHGSHLRRRFRDFGRCELDVARGRLLFHVTRPLQHFFAGEYDPRGAWGVGQAGCLCVCVCNPAADMVQLQATLQPLLPHMRVVGELQRSRG